MLNDFGDSKITVRKAQLLSAIKENREGHRAAFLKAQGGYRAAVIDELDKMLKEARESRGGALRVTVHLPCPSDHTKDYDRVIRMLEMSVADEVTVTEMQFSQYVLDDWGWKETFIATSARYSR